MGGQFVRTHTFVEKYKSSHAEMSAHFSLLENSLEIEGVQFVGDKPYRITNRGKIRVQNGGYKSEYEANRTKETSRWWGQFWANWRNRAAVITLAILIGSFLGSLFLQQCTHGQHQGANDQGTKKKGQDNVGNDSTHWKPVPSQPSNYSIQKHLSK